MNSNNNTLNNTNIMDILNNDLLKNIELNANMNSNDLEIMKQILGSINSNNNKIPNISHKEKNNLISKLSSNLILNNQNLPKELKNMNENEKKIYKEELRQKIKNKINQKKMLRTNNLTNLKNSNQNSLLNNAFENLKLDNSNIENNINNDIENNINNDIKNNINNDINGNRKNLNKINYLINNLNNLEVKKDENANLEENLDDYIK